MSLALSRQTVIVTGAAQGLGAAIARRFAAHGARLVLMDYNAGALADTAAGCGGEVTPITVDLSDRGSTESAIAAAMAVGRIDTLIHNAAILVEKPFIEEHPESFFRTFNVGIQAGYQLARALWPGMIAAGGGSLVFVSSRSGIQGFARETAYCATKFALEGFSQALAAEGAGHGIIVNTITPGMYMRTPMSECNYPPELKDKWVDPAVLTSAFVALAERRRPELNARRLNAWELSQVIDAGN